MKREPETIQIIVLKDGKKAKEINSSNAGREFVIVEIDLGMGPQRKTIKYPKGFLKPDTDCKAVIVFPGQVKIVG